MTAESGNESFPQKVDKMVCAAYADGQPYSEIMSMKYSDLADCYRYHRSIQEAYKNAVKKKK